MTGEILPIPPPYMQRKVLPAGVDTNIRPYTIFFSYMLLCFSLTVFIIIKLLKSYSVLAKSTTVRAPQRKHVQYFAFLALCSLGTTWYYMFRYFQTSYNLWFTWRSIYEVDPAKHHWGLWLKETSLFREAWETAIVGAGRYWWTQQIFFFACGLGLSMEQKGVRRGIKHTWAFMLLGQVVAISFATNLFLLAVLLNPSPPPAPSSTRIHPRKWLGPWFVNLMAVVATILPAYLLGTDDYYHTPGFMTVLLAPHVALLILPLARTALPLKDFTDDNVEFAEGVYTYLWGTTVVGGILLGLRTTVATYNWNGFQGIPHALFEHPAISSVGFDVIFCWISWAVWCRTQLQKSDSPFVNERERKRAKWSTSGSGTAVMGGDKSEVRRR